MARLIRRLEGGLGARYKCSALKHVPISMTFVVSEGTVSPLSLSCVLIIHVVRSSSERKAGMWGSGVAGQRGCTKRWEGPQSISLPQYGQGHL